MLRKEKRSKSWLYWSPSTAQKYVTLSKYGTLQSHWIFLRKIAGENDKMIKVYQNYSVQIVLINFNVSSRVTGNKYMPESTIQTLEEDVKYIQN